MWRGRYQLGNEVPIGVQVTDASSAPATAANAPTIRVYDSAGNRTLGPIAIPPKDIEVSVGLFEHFIRLGADFAPGAYSVVYDWTTTDSFAGRMIDWFEVLPGGDQSGAVIALHFCESPHGRFLLNQRDSGAIYRGKNPRWE